MKKTTLYKLVKLALFESLKEERKGIIKGSDLNLEKLTLLEEAQIRETLERKDEKKRRLLREQQELNNAEEIYEFLVENSNAGVPLEEIADNPLLKNVNIEGLKVIYNTISTLNLQEFIELLPTFSSVITITCACAQGGTNNCPNYGTMQIYEADCTSQPTTIDDRFVCCSSNNIYQDDNQYSLTIGSGGSSATIGANQGYCFDLSSPLTPPFALGNTGGPDGVGQISYPDLNTFGIQTTLGANGLIGNNQWQPSFYDGTGIGYVDYNNYPIAGSTCIGCAHPGDSTNYISTAGGCDVGGGVTDPLNIDCCMFSGCGAINTSPPANITSLTTIPTATNANGFTFSSFTGDEEQPWWTNDGSCTFGSGNDCTLEQISISGTLYNTVSWISGTVTSSYGSSYDGTNITSCTDCCEVPLCTNTALNGAVDQLGTSLTNTFVIAAGQYPSYEVINDDVAQCTVTACGVAQDLNNPPNNHVNYIYPPTSVGANDGYFAGDYTVNHDINLCVIEDPSCTINGYTNYNTTLGSTLNNTCYYNGCTDQVTGGISPAYVCTLFDWMCLDQTGTVTCDAAIHDTTLCTPNTGLPEVASAPNGIPFIHDQAACTGISGCTDDSTNQTQAWWTGTNNASYNYSDPSNTNEPTYGQLGVPTNYTANNTDEDGSCNWEVGGCTISQANNYSANLANITYVENNACNFDWCYDDPTATNYFCTIFPALCHNPTGTLLEFDPALVGNVAHIPQSCVGGCEYGCTDSTASPQPAGGVYPYMYANYDPNATCDDGSCTACVYGCTIPADFNYDALATCNDGTCISTVLGCTDPTANNHNSLANTDDGSCRYDGCTDNGSKDQAWYVGGNAAGVNYSLVSGNPANYPGVNACNVVTNYNLLYIDEDGSCDYQSCGGCTDPTACNYDILATIDDGSCTYPVGNCDCNGNPPAGDCDCNGNQLDCNNDCVDLQFRAALDDCNICAGGATGLTPNAYSTTSPQTPGPDQDCAGVCNGDSSPDLCGDCKTAGDTTRDGCVGCSNLQSADYDSNGYFSNYTDINDIIDDGTHCTFYTCKTITTNPLPTNYVCNDGTSTTVNDAWGNAQTVYPYELCEDLLGVQLTGASSAGIPQDGTGTNDIGTFIDQGCNIPTVGCIDPGGTQTWGNPITDGPFTTGVGSGINGQASNYTNVAGAIACDGTNSTTACVNGPDGVMQTTTINPFGCCCSYSPGCTDLTALNHNSNAKQDDGSCITAVPGCMQPGMDNYDPLANQDNGSCVFNGCVDNADSWTTGPTGTITPSPWNNYVCRLGDPNLNPGYDVTDANGNSLGTVGELLCNCSGFGSGGSCNENTNFNTLYGNYIDGTTFNSNTGLNNYDGTPNNAGSCIGYTGGTDGCTVNFYNQNDPAIPGLESITPLQYNANYTTQLAGSCEFYGCDNPLSSNYFCVDNPTLCDMTQNNGLGALDPLYGTLGQASYLCDYNESYNCDPTNGCTDPLDGTGTHASLQDCQSACIKCTEVTAKKCNGTTIRNYNCNGSGKDGLTIDGYYGDPTGPSTQFPVTQTYGIGQKFKIKEQIIFEPILTDIGVLNPTGTGNSDLPDNPNETPLQEDIGDIDNQKVWVSYEVTSIVNKHTSNTNLRDVPSTECFPPTWDCCSFATCGEASQIWMHNWHIQHPGVPTPSVNPNYKFCHPRTDGSGQYSSLSSCKNTCGDERIDPFKTKIDPEPPTDIPPSPPPKDIPSSPIDSKKININTVEPIDITRKTTGSDKDLKESKKLRKLIKKWRKNNL